MTEPKGPTKRTRKAAEPVASPRRRLPQKANPGFCRDETRAEAAAPKTSPREAAVEALMRLGRPEQLGTTSRSATSPVKRGFSLAELRELFPSKGAVLGGLAGIIDRKVLEGDGTDLADEPTAGASVRRVDASPRRMAPYRPPCGGFLIPSAAILLAARSQRSDAELASLHAGRRRDRYGGPPRQLKLQGVVIAFARVTQVWLDDDDPSLARTMARLDKEIRKGNGSWKERRMPAASRPRCARSGRSLLERRSRSDREDRLRDEPPTL